jgi:Spy/CpxP family protein refolding chaperone
LRLRLRLSRNRTYSNYSPPIVKPILFFEVKKTYCLSIILFTMKMRQLFLVIGIALLAINSPYLNAQEKFNAPMPAGERPGNEMMKPPPLTDQQKEQIKKMRITHLKEVQPVRNEMRELKAHYKTLTTTENPNIAEINKNIDAQTVAINKLMKLRAAHQQEIRKILTDEQKLLMDMKFERGNAGRLQGKPGPNMRMGNVPGRPMR